MLEEQSETNDNGSVAASHQSHEAPRIAVPGEVLVESKEILPGYGTYRQGDKIYSKLVGVVSSAARVIHIIPLSGVYVPRVGDYVVTEIKEVAFSFWNVDINSPYTAIMSSMDTAEYIPKQADLSRYFVPGDLVLAVVSAVTQSKYVNVSMKDSKCRKLIGGVVVHVTPSKVPRIIGKEGSMINLIKDKTKCYITVGQNGRVWLMGTHEDVALEAIAMVEKYAHTSGLTERISAYLDKALSGRGNAGPAGNQSEENIE